MKKKIISFLLIMILVLSFVGCNDSNNQDTDDTTENVENEESKDVSKFEFTEHYNQDMKGTTLNLYGVTDSIIPVLEEFEKKTGIKVENLTMKNGEILQRLKNEKESEVAIADIWFTGGADTFINASQNDLLHAYKSPQGESLDDIMKDENGYWYGTSLTLVNWVVNTELIEKEGLKMPTKWEDLLQPGLKGDVSMSNPASSGTAYNTVSAIIATKGQQEGWDYLEKLIEQVPFFTARGSDPKRHVINGEAIVGINASNGDREIEENNEHVKLVYPEDGTGWWPQPVAIVNGSENLEASKVFVDWILSKEGMKTLAETRYAAVARKDIERPEGIVDINKINLFPTDFQANAENRDAILEKWKNYVE
ncbi:MAG: ABC transporter substrate-binding protein [Bacillota bacterium]